MKSIKSVIISIIKHKQIIVVEKKKSYPRNYSLKELGIEVDRYGDSSPNSHLGASYYARASLGLTELERRNNGWLGWLSLSTSILALVFSVVAVKYAAEQTRLTLIQSTSERINQARSVTRAIELCKSSPELLESGLFDVDTGESAPCSLVLKQYKN